MPSTRANLAAAGVDAILVETLNSVREARGRPRAARATGQTSRRASSAGTAATLLSGEPLDVAVRGARDQGAIVVLVNCLPPSNVEACLDVLARGGLPFGAYANLGAPNDVSGFRRSETARRGFAGFGRAGSTPVRTS